MLIILIMLTMLTRYVEHDTLIWDYLNSSIHLAPYLEKKFERIYAGDAYRFYRQRWVCSRYLIKCTLIEYPDVYWMYLK